MAITQKKWVWHLKFNLHHQIIVYLYLFHFQANFKTRRFTFVISVAYKSGCHRLDAEFWMSSCSWADSRTVLEFEVRALTHLDVEEVGAGWRVAVSVTLQRHVIAFHDRHFGHNLEANLLRWIWEERRAWRKHECQSFRAFPWLPLKWFTFTLDKLDQFHEIIFNHISKGDPISLWSAKCADHPPYTGVNWKKVIAYKLKIPSWTCYCRCLPSSLLSFIDPSPPLHLLFKLQGCDQEHKECTDSNSLLEFPQTLKSRKIL